MSIGPHGDAVVSSLRGRHSVCGGVRVCREGGVVGVTAACGSFLPRTSKTKIHMYLSKIHCICRRYRVSAFPQIVVINPSLQ